MSKRVLLEYETGNRIQAQEFVKRLLDIMRLLPAEAQAGSGQGYTAVTIPLAARISGDLDLLSEAQQVARAMLSSSIITPLWSLAARIGLAVSAVLTGEDEDAREQYNALLSHRETLFHHTNMSADRLLGLLSHTMGNLDQAAEHIEDALAFCRQAGYRPELAWSCCDYAGMLLQQASTSSAQADAGDREKAMSLLDESLSISSELGMRPLMERVAVPQERIASQPARGPAYPDGLSQREVEVLRLVALGKNNREIVDELIIAEGTVRRHINNIYGKIGVANRAEATRYALTQGLTQ